MNFVGYIKRHFNVDVKTIYADVTEKKDPDIFKPNGSQIFHGYQGEGKSLSMFHSVVKLKKRYPKAVLVSNVPLRDYRPQRVKSQGHLELVLQEMDTVKDYIFYETYEELILLLRYCRNGEYGVVFCIDEIHNYFHSHDSKSMPMWVVQVFSQQRKQRMVILGTVQDWEDVIKAIRRQVDNLIECNRLGYFIRQTAVDPRTAEMQYGERTFDIRKRGFFFISKSLREGTDTYHVINSGREIMGGGDLEAPNLTQKGNKMAIKNNRSFAKTLSKIKVK